MKKAALLIFCLLILPIHADASKDWKEEVNKSLSEAQSIWNDAVKIIDDMDGPHYLVGKWSIQEEENTGAYPALIDLSDNKTARVDEHQCQWKQLFRDMPWYMKLIHKENTLAESSVTGYRAYVISIHCEGMETIYAYNRFSRLFVDYNRFGPVDFSNLRVNFGDQLGDFFEKIISSDRDWKKRVASRYQSCVNEHDLQYYPETDSYAQDLKIKHCGPQFSNYCDQYPNSRDCQRRVFTSYDRQDVDRSTSDNSDSNSQLKKWGQE